MTIEEVIAMVEELKPNNFDNSIKIKWLSEIDSIIAATTINTHEGEPVEFTKYDDETPLDTVLLATSPFDMMYRYWLEAKIDYENQDIPRYNNDMSLYEQMYIEYVNWYNRNHMYKKKTKLKVV